MSNINVNNITPLAGTTGTVSVSGSLVVSGSITANGNIILGNEAGDSVSLGAEVSSSIIPDATGTYDLGSPTKRWRSGSFEYISASKIDVDAATLSIGGTPFSKTDLDSIKDGKPLGTGIKQFKSPTDDSVYIRQSVAGKSWHYASDVALIKVQTSSFDLGAGNVPTTLEGSAIIVTGSTEVTGSLRVNTGNEAISLDTGTGGFTVNNLLDVLANYSSSGVEGGVASGDINLDGQVNVNDLLLVLAGYGNPNLIVSNTVIPPNVNHQFIGPTISINTGITLTISTGSFCSITL